MITKKEFITPSEKKIFVYDGIFTNQECLDIYLAISGLPFFRTNIDLIVTGNQDVDVKFISNIGPNDILGNLFYNRYSKHIDELDFKYVKIMSQYVNYSVLGTVDRLHGDSSSLHADPTFTIIQYGNFKWDKDWHGQTIFFDDNYEEIIFSTMVKPGRVVVFDSTIPHSATPPSKLAEHPRFTIASKLVIQKNER